MQTSTQGKASNTSFVRKAGEPQAPQARLSKPGLAVFPSAWMP